MDKYDKVSPNHALKRFFEENLIPNMKSKVLEDCRLSHELLYKRFFCNDKVCKLLFLNQFDLKNMYDKILENEPEDPLGPLTSIIKALSVIESDIKQKRAIKRSTSVLQPKIKELISKAEGKTSSSPKLPKIRKATQSLSIE